MGGWTLVASSLPAFRVESSWRISGREGALRGFRLDKSSNTTSYDCGVDLNTILPARSIGPTYHNRDIIFAKLLRLFRLFAEASLSYSLSLHPRTALVRAVTIPNLSTPTSIRESTVRVSKVGLLECCSVVDVSTLIPYHHLCPAFLMNIFSSSPLQLQSCRFRKCS